MAKRKETNNDLLNTQKKLRCSAMVSSSCSTSGTKLSPVFQWFELSGGWYWWNL